MTPTLTPSLTESNISSTWTNKSKQNNMVEFIRSVREYRKIRTEESANIINRHIQMLAVAIDTTIFDPNTSVVCEFFASMHDLLTFAEPRSSIIWGCVGVLQTACKNQAARHKLIHTYQFIPLLARVLSDHMQSDKKLKLLTLLQELSCGVKISWIIPNLEHLMTTLLRWVRNPQESEQVKLLSLGIVVNICFKNLPGTYMLSKCVDIKEFSKFVLTLKGVKIEAAACKLFIIMDYIHGVVPQETFVTLLRVTFKSVKESFLAKDPILLRQNIEFYLNVKTEGHDLRHLILENANEYAQRIEEIIYMISHEKKTPSGDCIAHHPDCMSLVFKFVQSIIVCNLSGLNEHYVVMAKVALNWIQTDNVASDALSFLKAIVETSLESTPPSSSYNEAILEMVLGAMPILLMNLHHIEANTKMNIAECTRLSIIMSLLQILARCDKTRERVIAQLAKEQFDKLFNLVIYANDELGDLNEMERAKDESNFTPEAFALYVNALCLISVLAKYYSDWQEYFTKLIEHKQIHVVVAEGLYTGNKDTRAAALEITGNPNFPVKAVAESMFDMCKTTPSSSASSNQATNTNLMSYTIVSSHSPELDEVIKLLNEARAGQRINIATCDVMELYEYKIATMGHAERSAMASVEAASTHCTHLQHQVASLESELSRIKQLFLHAEQMQKDSQTNIATLNENISELKGEKRRRIHLEEEVQKLNDIITQKDNQIAMMINKQEEIVAERDHAMKKVIPQLQESLKKMEKLSLHKDDIIKSMEGEISNVKQRLEQTCQALKSTEKELSDRSKELDDALAESEERRQLIEQIMKLAHKNK
ncbi:uncharacterized protein [Atheta coriaria]|uniref:uncharacterized protein n=1 Tax=Dalotia coriaria TaxID=877792 RepID=UPI0031F3C264